ncbi:MAG: glycosyltransferase [Bacteroidetes bacterium]|nr:glycosyltransferase [Bacteroidota bacterium]
MKLFVLTSRFPYPLEKGDKLRIYHQIRYLSKHHEIILCALDEKKITQAQLNQLKPFCSSIHVFRNYKWLARLRAMLWFLWGGELQVHYFYSKLFSRKITKLIFEHKPDHIYCQLIRMAEYVKELAHIPKSLDYMDAFSIGMMRQSSDTSFPFNHIYKQESKRLKAYEAQIFHDFDVCTIISEQDREHIKASHQEEIKIVPNGVDTDFFWYCEDGVSKTSDVLFLGNMSYYPNVKAAEYLAEHIYEPMAANNKNFVTTIAGANPAAHLLKLNAGNLKVLGWVDDVVEVYHSARVFVAPLFHGSGMQNKILEAMACGIPIITTTQTNNAINAKPEVEILIADTEEEMHAHIHRLKQDTEYYNALRANARRFVVQNFSWETFVNQLNQAIIQA